MEDIIVKDIKTLEFEINILKSQTAQNLIEIGKRLIEAKNQVPHGQWIEWLKSKVGFTERSAQKFMQIASEPNTNSISHLGVTKVFDLLSIPQAERQEFIEQNNVEDISTRELREQVKKYKEQNTRLLEDLDEALRENDREPKIIEKEVVKEVIKEVIPEDYEELKRKYESKSLLEKQIKALEEEIYKKDTKILSLQIAQKEAVNKLPETEQKKKLVDDSWTFVWRINSFLKDIGGLVYITQSIKELPTDQKNRYISAIENIVGWANQIKFNLEEEIKNE